MSARYSVEPDFNAADGEPMQTPRSRQFVIYAGVTLSLVALLVLLYLAM
ncbi:hypothetical protein GCM10009624_17050 [Gordonia sinesedis]